MSKKEGQAFEVVLERLSDIANQLEAGDIPLEESLKLFEEGVALAKSGHEKLDAAEAKLEVLMQDGSSKALVSEAS